MGTELFNRLMNRRHFSDEFLEPKYEKCMDPFMFIDMDRAVERICQAVQNKEKVLIYGDYDVDGVTASTLMYDTLKMAGVSELEIMLPNRFEDGYGMSKKVVQRVKDEGVGLVVTVDCGSANAEIVDELKENGVDTIVTDHHECPEELPNAVAVINPKRPNTKTNLLNVRNLAGVGVAFQVARALVQIKMIPEGQEKWLLDLVLIGTVCDSVPMEIENRRLCYFGMKVLAKTRRQGLRELMRVCKIDRIDTEALGFRIGPRLNAAGRMKDAEIALKLLMTGSRTEAANLAQELEFLNQERRDKQMLAVKEVEENGIPDDEVIVVKGDWHEGVIGIVAGKLMEMYKRPTFVLTEANGILKGSGRSFGGFDLAFALQRCKDVIIAGGGHEAACGLKLDLDKVEEFRIAVNKCHSDCLLEPAEDFFDIKEDVDTFDSGDLTLKILDEIRKLEPFGEGNEEPVFLLRNVYVCDAMKMGKNGEHLRLTVWGRDKKELKLVAFNAEKEWLKVDFGFRVNVWVKLVENVWKGSRKVEGRILKMTLEDDEVF